MHLADPILAKTVLEIPERSWQDHFAWSTAGATGMSSTWECFLCGKLNTLEQESNAARCVCCGRPSSYAPPSFIDPSRAKPLALHSLTTAQHQVRPELIESLERSGLDLVARDSEGWTALHCAAKLGQLHAVRSLLGAVNDRQDCSGLLEATTVAGGWRPLHLAVDRGHLAVVEELLLAGADVDARLETREAPTPLLLAAAVDRGERLVDLLLHCGADTLLTTRTLARNALHIAVAEQRVESVRILLARTRLVASVDAQGVSPMQDALFLPRDSPHKQELVALLETAVRSEQQQASRTSNYSAPALTPFLSSAVVRL